MKSIKSKLILLASCLVTSIIIGLSIIALLASSNALQNTSARMMKAMVKDISLIVENKVNWQLSLVEMIASSDNITDTSKTVEQKLSSLSGIIEKYGYLRIGIADLNGDLISSNNSNTNVGNREYFTNALEGISSTSDPIVSQLDGSFVIVFAAPIIINNEVTGVLVAVKDGNEISNIVSDITFGETGRAFMLNETGVKIAHYNADLVKQQDNDLVNVETNKELTQLAKLEQKMIQGETGVGYYHYNGSDKFLVFSPVNGTKWSVAVSVERDEVLSELNLLIKYFIFFAIIFLLISCVLVYFISDSISKRVKIAISYINPLADGDFTTIVSDKHLKFRDEIGHMIHAIYNMQNSVKNMLQLVIKNSAEIDSDAQNLSAVSQQMSASSNIVANSIQEVAKGTIAQADSLTDITKGLNQFSNNIEQIVADIKSVDSKAQEVMNLSSESNENMKNLAASVNNTNQSFSQFENGIIQLGDNINKIHNITNLINEISEQTNLLALNAAIEAARAGESGRGFSVVAEEIRRLAEQSKESSVNISSLIEEIYKENGVMIETTNSVSKEFSEQTEVINATIVSFNYIVTAVEQMIPKIAMVSKSTEEITDEKNEILGKIEDISAISEETSASSQEISASSEEMTSSSEDVANSAVNLGSRTKEMMKEIEKFKL
ncbi:MAG: methyl-accepting chemotaxis sensory transducer with Cache sensor [Anaerocolumna sp.]|jgi:methyl-accepting chemotaxis protein|nr:methyl-accepting chemotaxis sensory transducer with Cache sensor [Anaerocolumna sp.]